MSIETHIAWRYLWAHKGRNAIHIVSGVSALAVTVVTAAMVCVMSVMNGFGTVIEQMFSHFDPDIRIEAVSGKSFSMHTEAMQAVSRLPEVELLCGTIEQTALVEFEGRQLPALVKGVDTLFDRLTQIDSIIVDGTYCVDDGGFNRIVMGQGLAAQLSVGAHFIRPVHLYAPCRTQTVDMLRPDKSFRTMTAYMSGLFAVNQLKYDDRMLLVSCPAARTLFDYAEHEVTAVEIKLRGDAQQTITRLLGPDYKVMNRYEQQEDFFYILKMEKWLTALLMILIMLVAGFNIIGSLTMLMLDKKQDSLALRHLGASHAQLSRLFLYEGWMISVLGAVMGLLIGIGLCLGQQHFGWLKLGDGTEYVISTYPVAVKIGDLLLILTVVLLMGFLAAWIPARRIKTLIPVLLITLILPCLSACHPNYGTPPEKRVVTVDTVFTTARLKPYGTFYKGLKMDVWSLDLYTKGLTLDSVGHIAGSGCNLYLSDMFVAPGEIPDGTFTIDSLPGNHTILAGKDFEGTYNGAYLLLIDKGQLSRIYLFSSGTVTVHRYGDSLEVSCHLMTQDKQIYDAKGVPSLLETGAGTE